MAPQRGADSFLAARTVVASARVFLALAALAALLALPGCGGGDEETTSAGTQSAGKEAAAKQASEKQGKEGAADARPGARAEQGKSGGGIATPKGAPEQAPSKEQIENATVANIYLESPSFTKGQSGTLTLPSEFTCDGANRSPALTWKGVPGGTEELVLLVLNLGSVNGDFFVDWALAGLDPSLRQIGAGETPRGAVLGRNSLGKLGYSICPQGKGKETFIFSLYALPEALDPKAGFDPLALREEVLAQSGSVGLLAASYGEE